MEVENNFVAQWTADEIRRVGYRVVDIVAEYMSTLASGPVFRPVPASLAEGYLSESAPIDGMTADDILAEFQEKVASYPFGNGHPRFWGWVNSPPVAIGVLAEALAAAMDPSCAGGNHAAIYVERQVLNWFKQMLGFPASSMGLLVSGGSMASLTALAVARHAKAGFDVRRSGLQGVDSTLICYLSEEGHGCIRKAGELLGIGSDNIRTVAVDQDMRMRVDDLTSSIASDLAAGLHPFAVVASAGTVNTGAIDPLREIADVCRRYGLWYHIDGAYGAPAVLTQQYRDDLAAMSLGDSVAVDPHKWLSIPVEAGLVLVKDAEAMRDAFSLTPPYLRTDGNPSGVGGPPWFSEYGFQQTRGFRALKVWMALKHYGFGGYQRMIERQIELARYLHRRVTDTPDLQAIGSPGLSIVCFRYVPPTLRDDATRADEINRLLLERIQLGGKAFLSSTVVRGAFVLRACIVNYQTEREDLDFLIDLVRQEGSALLETHEAKGKPDQEAERR